MILYFINTLFKRSYKYLLLTFFSILIGAFLFGSVLGITQSISNYFVSEGKTLIGGDIVLSSSRGVKEDSEIIKNILSKSEKVNREYSVQAVFKNSVSSSTSVASLRAVESNFPLYGELVLEDDKVFSLADGEKRVYVEQGFLDKIDAKIGDSITLGIAEYIVSGVIKKEPDAVSVGVSFTPKVIMLLSDFKKSELDLTQSRANYKLSIKENKNNPFTKDELAAAQSFAKENKIRFDDSSDGPNNLVRGLSSVQSFSGIVLGIALFLVMVNIIANLSYVISKFRKTIAILKTFGATSKQIQIIYLTLLGAIGVVAGFFGALFGAMSSNALLPTFSKFLESNIENISILPIATLSAFMGLLIISASSLPFLLSLNEISPKQLLSKAILKRDAKLLKSILFYLPIPVLLFIFLYIISSDILLSFYSVSGLVALFFFFLVISFLIINILYKKRDYFSLIISSSISSLKWRGVETVIVLASIMTAFSGIFIISAIEKNIITNLNQNISNSAPSLYIVDINKSQLERVREIAGDSFAEYPTIRGRLLKVNEKDMTASDNGNITRELSMTYRSNLLKGEKIINGSWHEDTKIQNGVSIDSTFAEELGGVNVGDTIEVFVQGINIDVMVTSLHEAERSAGTPYFYLVFSPDSISKFPASYFATVSTDAENIKSIETKLGNEFPNIIPIQTGKIIDTVSKLLENVILVVKVIGVPSLILGLILIMIMTSQSLYERRGDVLILRAFGLVKSKIIKLFIIEICFIIFIASIISFIIAHGIAFALNKFLFNFEIFTISETPAYITISVLIVVIIFAYLVSGAIVKGSLKEMLGDK
jgi:putative ABC transport system permease protein